MSKKTPADIWLAVDKDGSEWAYGVCPERDLTSWTVTDGQYLELPLGAIERMAGGRLTWKDDPIQLLDGLTIANVPEGARIKPPYDGTVYLALFRSVFYNRAIIGHEADYKGYRRVPITPDYWEAEWAQLTNKKDIKFPSSKSVENSEVDRFAFCLNAEVGAYDIIDYGDLARNIEIREEMQLCLDKGSLKISNLLR